MGVMKRKCVIVDVDGTLVNVSSIRHHVLGAMNADGSYNKKNFDAFHRDSVNCPVIPETVVELRKWMAKGYFVVVVTARSWKYYPQTAWWLAEHEIPHDEIFMRMEGDHRKDYIVKKEILDRMRRLGWDPQHAIDDNPSVLELWVEEGLGTTTVPGWEVAA